MKFLTIIFAVITINYYGNSQELKKVTKTLAMDWVENYYVFKNDTKIKQGEYSLMTLGDTVRNGFYNNDEKSGIWKYYYLNSSISKYLIFHHCYKNLCAQYRLISSENIPPV